MRQGEGEEPAKYFIVHIKALSKKGGETQFEGDLQLQFAHTSPAKLGISLKLFHQTTSSSTRHGIHLTK